MNDLKRASRKGKKKNKVKEIWKRLRKNKSAMLGLFVLVFFSLVAIFAGFISPESLVTQQKASIRLQPPSAEHWFGTDAYGRDVFTRVIYGARISLTIGFVTAAISLAAGGLLGASAAFYGGRADELIMRVMDILTAIPGVQIGRAHV